MREAHGETDLSVRNVLERKRMEESALDTRVDPRVARPFLSVSQARPSIEDKERSCKHDPPRRLHRRKIKISIQILHRKI